MAQVGVLGDLKYDSKAHSWVLDLGASLSSIKVSTENMTTGLCDDQGDTIRNINRALGKHDISYRFPDLTKGEDLDTWEVLFDILELVEEKDRVLGAFLLIGAANHFLEMAVVANNPDTVIELRRLARNRVDQIPRRNPDINIDATALYNLLEKPPQGAQPLRKKLQRASQPLVILFLAADPSDADRLRLLDERRTLETIVQSAIVHNAFKVVDAPGCRVEDISQALQRYEPTLLHFSGHGTPEGFKFQDESSKAANVKPEAFARLLALAHQNGLEGAVMNACYADTEAHLLADAVGYAVAMKGKLSDRAANIFTREFYKALGSGKTFDDAFKWAIAGAMIDPKTTKLHPKLFKKKDGVPPRYS